MTDSDTYSCDEGEYVKGLTYEIVDGNTNYPYFITAIGLMCTSSTLGEHMPRDKNSKHIS